MARTTKTKTRTTAAKRATKKTPPATRSVVPTEFRERYGKAGTCGDEVATKLAKVVGTDPDKLRRVAEANGCWRDGYEALNPGLARMTVGNRLRKLVRDGGAIKWGR